MQFITDKAGALTLQPVNRLALMDIIADAGGLEALTGGNASGNAQAAIQASNRMLTYAFGWGVVEVPDADALATLAALGKPTNLPEIARANWLRYLVLSEAEASALLAAVVKLTLEE